MKIIKDKISRFLNKLKNNYEKAEYLVSPEYKDLREQRDFYANAPMQAAVNLLRRIPLTEKDYLKTEINFC